VRVPAEHGREHARRAEGDAEPHGVTSGQHCIRLPTRPSSRTIALTTAMNATSVSVAMTSPTPNASASPAQGPIGRPTVREMTQTALDADRHHLGGDQLAIGERGTPQRHGQPDLRARHQTEEDAEQPVVAGAVDQRLDMDQPAHRGERPGEDPRVGRGGLAVSRR
jgi:hypothetical protein